MKRKRYSEEQIIAILMYSPRKMIVFRSRIFHRHEILRMKKSRCTESQIFQIFRESEAGIPVLELRHVACYGAVGPFWSSPRMTLLIKTLSWVPEVKLAKTIKI